jgi:hypothetical protein
MGATRCPACGDVLMTWECEFHADCAARNGWREPDIDWVEFNTEYNERLDRKGE